MRVVKVNGQITEVKQLKTNANFKFPQIISSALKQEL